MIVRWVNANNEHLNRLAEVVAEIASVEGGEEILNGITISVCSPRTLPGYYKSTIVKILGPTKLLDALVEGKVLDAPGPIAREE